MNSWQLNVHLLPLHLAPYGNFLVGPATVDISVQNTCLCQYLLGVVSITRRSCLPPFAWRLQADLSSGEGLREAIKALGGIVAVVNCAALSQPVACENKPEAARSGPNFGACHKIRFRASLFLPRRLTWESNSHLPAGV